MASLNTMRTKFGVILSVIIGGALLAFILSLKTEMGFSGNDPKVGEIDGDKILYSEYLAAYDDMKAQMGGDGAYDDETANQLISATWQSLLANHVLLPGLESLGIAVPESEREAMLRGERTVRVPACGDTAGLLWEPNTPKMEYAYFYITPGDLSIEFETR